MSKKPISVTQLNGYVKRVLQSDAILGNVFVSGEISNLNFHSSGHIYFHLKDAGASVRCFLPANVADGLKFKLDDGLGVVASGYISVYEKGGTYSLNIRDINIEGIGNLAVAFEKLKAKLADEGLFDSAYKKPLPTFPKNVAIVTSPTGAAIEDMVTIIKSRNRYVNIFIWPVHVQGDRAASEISSAISAINAVSDGDLPDVIIVGRGGGSVEDLWAFNEEPVARAIFASSIPVISAVGHETDFTIADFVADIRAETPTAAAHMAVPNTDELCVYLGELRQRLDDSVYGKMRLLNMTIAKGEVKNMRSALSERIERHIYQSEHKAFELNTRITDMIANGQKRALAQSALINALNPFTIMRRGYSVLMDKGGDIIKSVDQLTSGASLTAVLTDGRANLTVENIEENHEDN